jgi:hypothetical protein
MKVFYAVLIVILLILIGQKSPKVGLALAGLILLSTITINIKNFEQILKGDVFG